VKIVRKKIFGLSVLALFVTFFACVPAEASNVNLTIINNTGYQIYHVFVSSPASNSWGNDMLRSDQILRNGDQFVVSVPNGSRWDIKLIDEDGDSYTKRNWGSTTGSGPFRATFTLNDID